MIGIELQWATLGEYIPTGCNLCGAEFEATPVIIRIDPFGEEICPDCLRALDVRKEQVPNAPWPTFAEYQEAARSHPAPMFASLEELEAAAESVPEGHDPLWRVYEASVLWTADLAA